MKRFNVCFLFLSLFILLSSCTKNSTSSSEKELLKDPKALPTIKWSWLNKFDYKTKKGPKEIFERDGKLIRMPGFIVPLSDTYSSLDEFLLVPNAQACIHVPPPPPNLIVFVKLRKAITPEEAFNPATITGIFKIEESKSKHGGSAFKIDGIKLEKYSKSHFK